MQLAWSPTSNPKAAYYDIQYSEDDGSSWLTYNNKRPIRHGGWINHHGNLECGYGFAYCLKRYKVYHYRVRVLDGNHEPITDWSNVVSARSFEWPTQVALSDPTPKGPYIGEETVYMELVEAVGPYLYIDWTIKNNHTASHNVEAGCKDGYYWQDPETRYCRLLVVKGSLSSGSGSLKLAAPVSAKEVSVEVWVKGIGTYPSGEVYTDEDNVTLGFKSHGSYTDP